MSTSASRLSVSRLTRCALGASVVALTTLVPVAGPASAQRSVTPAAVEIEKDALSLEPIGGLTKLANVRIITRQLCPTQSEVIIARISGAGFKPDSNVFGNTELALVPKMPDGSGYVAPIFADWDYLATAHEARTPLQGLATITFLCADKDLERIDAEWEGEVRFDSSGGTSTYLQQGGPRVASGLPGVPAPGNGGVPKDAPVAAPAGGTATTDGVAPGQSMTTNAGSDVRSDVAPTDSTAPAQTGNSPQTTDGRLTASAAKDGGGGPPVVLLTLGAVALLLIAAAAYFFARRPELDDFPGGGH